ncbi:peroxidase family protein [Intrasporangium flavum]|uniref:peroxidase family protein n=1 Tax=Intrasporangium flavum TaxID=1428657 RepID=UPI001F60FA23|nr:peroxidase family protein [Intrasporangium flavum]
MKHSIWKSPGRAPTRATATHGRIWLPSLTMRFRRVAAGIAFVVPVAMVVPSAASAATAPTGNGFVVTAGDLTFILKQIKIAERHSVTWTASNPCGTLVGPASDQIPDRLTSYGLRTTDGSCNNLFPGRETFAAADQPFPHLATPTFRDAEPITASFPVGPPGPTSYKQQSPGNVVVDSQPRTVSNLVVDQTSTNPAAIAAAGFPVRSQGNPGKFPCTTDPDPLADPPVDGVPAGCVPSHQTLDIPNVTTDVGLSPPFNSMFTFFGQFFDHGVDQTVKDQGTVFVPLKADDPLRTLGPDGKANTGDEVPASQAFMVLSRAQVRPGPDGVFDDNPATSVDETADNVPADNTDSPWVDQSQTYTSHSSHQVFLREYSLVGGKPVSTGKFLGGLAAGQTYPGSPDGTDGISTWASVKRQAAQKLGLLLVDRDVTNIPMLATDPYGNFIPGPARGLPQYVTATGLVEGDIANPVPVPANVAHFNTPFLTDIAHNADPSPQDTDHNPSTPPVAPTPDADTSPSADFANQPAGTYDDEMLDAHFACGDGRCNENIALSTIHQIFHSEHNRLADDITNTLNDPANAALLADFQAPHLVNGTDASYGFGGRLFQAARFVTEMEYQHLVFEEFGRKMVPAIRPFHVYSPDMNPAIEAEFAHAVYRFGHSMLDDQVARTDTNPDGSKLDNSLPLLTAFLNPPAFFDNKVDPTHPVYTPREAAGAIVMGSSDQTGNEIDEFVTETLRNNLLGLPLDLPTLNMTRARDAGVPRLNEFRRAVFADTNDGQLTPYTSWSDYGQHLKHPESLINFVAAYGTHDTITSATTLKARRDAARAIVDPRPAVIDPTTGAIITPADVQPADAADFMFGTGAWADANGRTTTGLDDVDLWVGGLAEVTNLFGGLLGSTFNYVFQTQLEKLQDGDRLYYLARTPGMNLRTQLEGNSFSEMIQRNTDGADTLKADAFATADCKFQLSALKGTAADFTALGSTVADDPNTPDCDESLLLLRSPDGTISYRQRNTVDPPGINGQSVYNGTAGVDRIKGGNDNDTFWGGAGNDVIDGQGGDDIALGGDGNDIITDLDGADVPKGGPGNDAIDAGPGDDIPMGNAGQDFINGGANDNETFAGPGNDYVIAGQGADAVFGDGGDDWIEGGSGQDLLQGDHGAPFFDDPAETAPGNDIFVGQVGENDYDAEGGDDIMAQNAAVDRNAGAGGFDWAIGQYNTVAQNDDMMINNNLGGLPIQIIVNRDRWQETEADSGTSFDDILKGTDGVLAFPRLIGGGGFTGCNALDQAGVARIKGLAALLPPVAQWQGTAAETASLSVTGTCPLSGPVWGEGDILLGGPGSDTFTGRSGNEIIDGDNELRTAISVTDGNGHEFGRTDLMENKAIPGVGDGNFGPGTTGMTLQQAVFAGLVDPGHLVNVREVADNVTTRADCSAAVPLNCDTSVYAGPLSQYTVTTNANGSITVADANATVPAVGAAPKDDGVDTLWNIEQLKFSDTTVTVATPSAPTITSLVPGNGSVTVNFTGPASATSFTVKAFLGTDVTAAPVRTITGISRTATSATVTGLTNGSLYTITVAAVNQFGTGASASGTATPLAPTPPAAPTIGAVTSGNTTATVSWTINATPAAPASSITSFRVQVRLATTNALVRTVTVTPGTATSTTVTALTNGTAYRFQVIAVNAVGSSAPSALSASVTPATVPGAPVIGNAANGRQGGAITAIANWAPPASNGGSAITGYRVTALRMGAGNTVLGTTVSALQPATARQLEMTLPQTGNYRFTVQAVNAVGGGAQSARSNQVLGR